MSLDQLDSYNATCLPPRNTTVQANSSPSSQLPEMDATILQTVTALLFMKAPRSPRLTSTAPPQPNESDQALGPTVIPHQDSTMSCVSDQHF